MVPNASAGSWSITGMTVLSQQLFDESELGPITILIWECQIWLYGHMPLFKDFDPTYGVVSVLKTLIGGHQGNTHSTHGWDKLIDPAGRGLG